MSLHRVVMFEGGWGVFYYIRFLLERGDPPLPPLSGLHKYSLIPHEAASVGRFNKMPHERDYPGMFLDHNGY